MEKPIRVPALPRRQKRHQYLRRIVRSGLEKRFDFGLALTAQKQYDAFAAKRARCEFNAVRNILFRAFRIGEQRGQFELKRRDDCGAWRAIKRALGGDGKRSKNARYEESKKVAGDETRHGEIS